MARGERSSLDGLSAWLFPEALAQAPGASVTLLETG